MKAIVVFDMPDGINLEQYKGFLTVDRFYVTDEEVGTKIDAEPMKFKWLNIKPMPKKPNPVDMELEPYIKPLDAEKWEFYCIGFNDVLKEITE